MNSTGSVFHSPDRCGSSSPFISSDVLDHPGSTSCTEDKQTPGAEQCFLTHSNHEHATTAARDASTSTASSPGDLAFAQKCADLQRFIRPLLELLHGLKSGRFDKGLTGFQQSVAIDRLQRILGILQKPDMGEKYLQSLLQIEVMLKAWFPQKDTKTNQSKTIKLSHHWCQNQLHIPVKKRKMTWTDPERSSAASTKHKHLKLEKHAICDTVTSLDPVSTCPERDKQKAHEAETNRHCEPSCTNGHEFIGITSSCKGEDKAMLCGMSPPSPATQDNCVSSSTTTEDSP